MSSSADTFSRLSLLLQESKTLVDALKGTPYEEQARALYKPPRKARVPKDPKDVKTKPAAGKVEKPSKKNKDKEAKKGKKAKKTGTQEVSQ